MHHASSKRSMADFRKKKASSESSLHPNTNGEPNPKAGRAKPEERRKFLRDYIRWLWPYRFALGSVFAMAAITTALNSVWPLAIRAAIDLPGRDIPADQKFHRLMLIGIVTFGVLILKQGIDTLRGFRMAALNAKVTFRLRGRLFKRVLSLPLQTLGEMKSGGIVARLSGDVDAVSGLVQQAIISPGVAILSIVFSAFVIVWIMWRLALVGLIMLPPMALVSFVWIRRVRPVYRSIREDRTGIDSRVTETFGGIRVVRAFRREPHEERGYAVGHHTVIRKVVWAENLEQILSTMWGLLMPGTILLIVWVGVRLVLAGRATVGDIVALQIYAMLLIQPVWQIISSVSGTQRSLAAMERIFSVLELKQDKPDVPGAVPAPRIVETIRFDHVGFEYRPGVSVIQDFNLEVAGGQIVALVGPSGAGKTTLTDLVARFYDPTSGAILLNGADLRQIQLKSYRSLLAIVQQETFLFDGTVNENIGYGRRQVTDAQIMDAARRANAHEYIERLPSGYNTIIGERGFKLSGGQRQRLSIARAILADPQILILDEATSNLDTESEQLIQASLGDLFKGRTTFVIAHRLSTITHADLIVVMDQGKIVETGRHEDLMANRGMYYEMVSRQQKSFEISFGEGAGMGMANDQSRIGSPNDQIPMTNRT